MGLNRSDNRLYSMLANGAHIDPSSKRLQLHLEGYSPTEAIKQLSIDRVIMIDALHELAHFHSLTNDIGNVLTARGFLAALASEDLKERIEKKLPGIQSSLNRYLELRLAFKKMVHAWMPFLEGLAVFLQTSYPHIELDTNFIPVGTLVSLGVAIQTLDPPLQDSKSKIQEVDNDYIDSISMGLQSAAYEALAKGPEMRLDKNYTLAAALELGNGDWSIPYFLGNAYFRRLQIQLQRINPAFEAAERVFELILRILQQSARSLLGRNTAWDLPEDIERLYGWIELVEKIPASRFAEVSQLDENVDLLTWLREGKLLVRQATSTHDFAQLLEDTIPADLEYFGKVDDLSQAIGGTALQTFAINLSSGGRCQVIGWIPNFLPGTNYISLRIDSSTWWLVLGDTAIAELFDDQFQIPELPRKAFQKYGFMEKTPRSSTFELEVECFLTMLKSRLPNVQLKFSVPGNPNKYVVTEITGGPIKGGRAILHEVPAPMRDIFNGGEYFREIMTGAISDLENLASFLDIHGYSLHANQVRKACQDENVELSRLDDLIFSRILTGLLGSKYSTKLKSSILDNQLKDILIDVESVRTVLTAAYSVPCAMSGLGVDDIAAVLEMINETAEEVLAKPLFKWDYMGRVLYLGLWGR